MRSSHVTLDQVDVAFDDERSVASAGLLLPATLAERLGVEQLTDRLVDLGLVDLATGRARPGPAASCSPWSTRCWPAVTVSTTSSCCERDPPRRCWVTG